MIKKLFIISLIFLFTRTTLSAKDVIIQDSNINTNFSGKVLEIKDNQIKILNSKNNKIETLYLDKSKISQLKEGDTLILKAENNFNKNPNCRCLRIRERIRKLAEQRKSFHKIRKNSRPHFNSRRHKK